MAKKIGAGTVAEIGSALIAAAAAGYYFYGSKRAKKNRDVVAKELKTDWKLIQKEIKKINTKPLADHATKVATKVGKQVLAKGQKTVSKVVKKASTVAKKYR